MEFKIGSTVEIFPPEMEYPIPVGEERATYEVLSAEVLSHCGINQLVRLELAPPVFAEAERVIFKFQEWQTPLARNNMQSWQQLQRMNMPTWTRARYGRLQGSEYDLAFVVPDANEEFDLVLTDMDHDKINALRNFSPLDENDLAQKIRKLARLTKESCYLNLAKDTWMFGCTQQDGVSLITPWLVDLDKLHMANSSEIDYLLTKTEIPNPGSSKVSNNIRSLSDALRPILASFDVKVDAFEDLIV